jgi:hydroxyacylglutathione hydrolase
MRSTQRHSLSELAQNSGSADMTEAAKRRLAGELLESVHAKVSSLPDGTMILPGHGAGSLCGAGMAERPESTLGYERHCNVFMAREDKDTFVNKILGSVPQFPPYYKRMKSLNSEGPSILHRLPGSRALSPSEFEAEVEKKNGVILDVRTPDAFGGTHIPGSFNIGSGSNLSLWSGWVLPYDCPIFLVGDARTDLEEVRKSLIRVGYDMIEGALKGGIESWIAAGKEQAHIAQISVLELERQVKQAAFVLDVRSPEEWKSGHIAYALHIPAGHLQSRLNELPGDCAIHVICGSGYRSSIACSILRRAGFEKIVNTIGGMTAWRAQRLAEEKI